MFKTTRSKALAIFIVAAIVGLAPSALAAAPPAKKLLRIRLSGPVLESPDNPAGLFALLGNQQPPRSLHHWLKSIRDAQNDSAVRGILLIIEDAELSLAQAEELSRALGEFRGKGKPVHTFMDYGTNVSYALAAASSDHITLAENSELALFGLYAEAMYFKGLLDKIGVQADMLHCGAYKSALEPYTRTEPSKEAAENINWLLDGIYARWIDMIAKGRNLSPDAVRQAIDNGPIPAEVALKTRLVDDVSSFEAFRKRVSKEFGPGVEVMKRYSKDVTEEIDFNNPFAMFSLIGSMMKGLAEPTDPGIGLIYIDGGIMVGRSDTDPFTGDSVAGSTTIRGALQQALDDEKIRAVVVRVNSPGGSAIASDIIYDAARRLGAAKPLFVSMGSVAGSGGYYVSIPGETIYAEASTITGSIGVVGGKLVWKGLFEEKLGITSTEFTRGQRAGLFSPNRTWSDEERAYMQEYMDRVYAQFKGRVSDSRGKRLKKDLEDIAGGRVYTGQQALELGLVDKIGGLREALDAAISKAGLTRDCPVYQLPKASEMEQFLRFLEALSGQSDKRDEFEVSATAVLRGDPLLRAAAPLLQSAAPAKLRDMLRALRGLAILQRERVGMFLPVVPDIR